MDFGRPCDAKSMLSDQDYSAMKNGMDALIQELFVVAALYGKTVTLPSGPNETRISVLPSLYVNS